VKFLSAALQHYPLDLTRLPSTWAVADVGELSKVVQPGFPSGKHNQDGRGVPHLRPMNISRAGVIDLADVKYVEDKDGPRLSGGDVLFNNTNSPALIGKTAVIQNARDWAFSNHMTRITPATGIMPSYLAHHLHYLWMSGYFRHRCVNHVNQASISSGPLSTTVPIALAPIAEQERIVAAMEEQFSRLDAGVAALQRARQNLKRMRASILAALLFDTSGRELPWVKLGDVLVHGRYGSSTKCSYDAPGLPVLRIPNVQSGSISLADMKRAVDQDVDLTSALVATGDVLVVRTNGSRALIGRAAVVPPVREPLAFASYLIQLRVNSEVLDPAYLVATLTSPHLRVALEQLAATSAGQYNISLAKLRSVRIPLPTAAMQHLLMTEAEFQLMAVRRLERDVERESILSDRLRSSILSAAFSGTLVPQDPTDEPASILLERIVAARAVSNGHGAPMTRTRRTRVTA